MLRFLNSSLILIVFVCLSSGISPAQPLEIRLLLLTDQPAGKEGRNGSEMQKKIEMIVSANKEMLSCTDRPSNAYYERFRLLDLDRDGDEDLLYHGACEPYSRLRVWMKTDDGYQKIHDEAGELIWVNPLGEGMEIGIRKESVGCDPLNRATILAFHKGKQDAPGTATSLEWHRDLQWNRYKMTAAERFNDTDLELRLSSEVDDEPRKSECSDTPIPGNSYLDLKGKTEGAIFQQQEDGWRVVMAATGDGQYRLGWNKGK